MRRVGIPPAFAREQAQKLQTGGEAPKPLPAPTGPAPYRLKLSDVVPNLDPNVRTFHNIGDTGGITDPNPQLHVVKAMIADLPNRVEFAYHNGDWAYYEGEQQAWVAQVFEAYAEYNRPMLGISGNHDGGDYANWVRYMCSAKPELLPEIEEFHRDTMDQPNVYFTLEDELLTIIGLASNVPSGGEIEQEQAEWLVEELKAAPEGRALCVALHHPPYSVDAHHGGSQRMGEVLDKAFSAAGRYPHLVLSGHVHDSQYFTRVLDGHTIGYLVNGNGGYRNLHPLASDAKPGMEVAPGVTFEYGDASEWGFWRFSVTTSTISATYIGVDREGNVTPDKYSFSLPVA